MCRYGRDGRNAGTTAVLACGEGMRSRAGLPRFTPACRSKPGAAEKETVIIEHTAKEACLRAAQAAQGLADLADLLAADKRGGAESLASVARAAAELALGAGEACRMIGLWNAGDHAGADADADRFLAGARRRNAQWN